jgi:hypothetical protein
MNYTIYVSKERKDSILKEMCGSAKLVREEPEWSVIEVSIDSAIDCMNLYHAGISYGTSVFTKQNK